MASENYRGSGNSGKTMNSGKSINSKVTLNSGGKIGEPRSHDELSQQMAILIAECKEKDKLINELQEKLNQKNGTHTLRT